MPANKKILDSSFVAGEGPQGAVRPRMSGRGKAPVSDAANSASPSNKGGINLLRKVSEKGVFKSGLTK